MQDRKVKMLIQNHHLKTTYVMNTSVIHDSVRKYLFKYLSINIKLKFSEE